VTYTDDTGWRVGGENAQLMIFVTDTATVFQVRPRHRNEEVREVIGEVWFRAIRLPAIRVARVPGRSRGATAEGFRPVREGRPIGRVP
jgi:hypothetical protein